MNWKTDINWRRAACLASFVGLYVLRCASSGPIIDMEATEAKKNRMLGITNALPYHLSDVNNPKKQPKDTVITLFQ